MRCVSLKPTRSIEDRFTMAGDEIATATLKKIRRHARVIGRCGRESNGFRRGRVSAGDKGRERGGATPPSRRQFGKERESMRLLLLATVAGAAMITTPCAAQDKPDFSGFRLEALGGYDNLSGGGDGKDGFVYGVAAGYDAALGRARLGLEGEITDSTVRQRDADVLTAGDRLRTEAGRDFYVGVRAGYVVSPKLMAYAKAGYTNARVTSRYTSGAVTTREADNLDGFRLGAGLEYAISPRFFVKGEYRYSHYGDQNGKDIDADRHQVMAGVGVRF